jgi:hypothetical protein
MNGRFIAAAVAVLALAGCGSGGVDYTPAKAAEHRAAVEAQLGHPVTSWPAYERSMQKICDLPKDAFSYEIAKASEQQQQLITQRIGVKYMCPDRSPEIDAALDGIAAVDRACALPASARTKEQSLMAEAMDCP